tara:strand:+ start:9522 stop:10385 length:864 start_codon:yes stop_codon:yes gene_type:complete
MKHILLPTDFSENSWNGIAYAMQLFKEEECTFYLYHAYTPIIYHLEYVLVNPEQFGIVDTIKNTAEENLNQLVLRISTTFKNNKKHNFKTYAKFDAFISGIQAFVQKYPIDLIVVGTKGATGAKEVLFGSNTVQLFQKVKCPILAIPSAFTYEAPQEILFPTDLEVSYKNSKLSFLKNLAVSKHARVNAMHVSTGNDLTEIQENNKAQLEILFQETAFLFHAVKSMNISDAVNEFQLKYKINLLAMINNKHSFFESLFFKNTINQIGFHLTIPFLVIPSMATDLDDK